MSYSSKLTLLFLVLLLCTSNQTTISEIECHKYSYVARLYVYHYLMTANVLLKVNPVLFNVGFPADDSRKEFLCEMLNKRVDLRTSFIMILKEDFGFGGYAKYKKIAEDWKELKSFIEFRLKTKQHDVLWIEGNNNSMVNLQTKAHWINTNEIEEALAVCNFMMDLIKKRERGESFDLPKYLANLLGMKDEVDEEELKVEFILDSMFVIAKYAIKLYYVKLEISVESGLATSGSEELSRKRKPEIYPFVTFASEKSDEFLHDVRNNPVKAASRLCRELKGYFVETICLIKDEADVFNFLEKTLEDLNTQTEFFFVNPS